MRNLDIHIVLEVDDSDPASDAEIALEVRRTLESHSFAVVDVEELPEGTKVVLP